MLKRLSCALIVMATVVSPSRAQCPPLGECATDCGATCQVNTLAELNEALVCYAEDKGCCHIIIPLGVTINLSSAISLGSDHCSLHLTVNGTLRWTGANSAESAMIVIDSTSNITIDGSGLFTSGSLASQNAFIAWPIRATNSSGVTVRGLSQTAPLRFAHVSAMAEVVSVGASRSSNAVFKHLDGVEITRHGIFADADGVLVFDCHVHRPVDNPQGGTCYHERGFRFYGDSITIRDCSAYHMISEKQGFWILSGNNDDPVNDSFLIDGFACDRECWLGPNPAADYPWSNLQQGWARNLKIDYLTIYLGTQHVDVTAMCADHSNSIIVTGSGCFQPCPPFGCAACPLLRFTNNIHWANVSDPVLVDPNVPAACPNPIPPPAPALINCLDYATVTTDSGLYCAGDITDGTSCDPGMSTDCLPQWTHGPPNGEVNVNDLLVIIGHWGACQGGTEPKYICRADIVGCDGQVDVNDLLAVIGHWGPCDGPPTNPPESMNDCFDVYCEGLSGEEWQSCVTRCLEAWCAANPGDPNCD